MVSKIMASAPDILNQLAGSTVISTRCQLINVDDDHGTVKKCLLTVTTDNFVAPPAPTATISELLEVDEHITIAGPEHLDMSVLQGNDLTVNDTTSQALDVSVDQGTEINALATTTQATPAVNKRKKVDAPLDVLDLRRSRHLAGLSVGFKDQAAATKAKNQINCKKNLAAEFEYELHDPLAAPPPELPLATIQAIATQQCQIPPEEVSGEILKSPVDHD